VRGPVLTAALAAALAPAAAFASARASAGCGTAREAALGDAAIAYATAVRAHARVYREAGKRRSRPSAGST
jgi:hypothetical protein